MTTRAKRSGEQHGVDYFFVSQKMFEYKKRAGHFLEWQKVFDKYYGTPNKHVVDLLTSGTNVLLCIDVKGAAVVLKKYPQAASIFIKTSSFQELKKRLLARGSEEERVMDLRLRTAKEELKESKHYQYVIINDHLSQAFKDLQAIVTKVLQE